jgi:hypothetical protein
MGENYYRKKATRRNLIIFLSIGVIVMAVFGVYFVRNIYYDICTQSFIRQPEEVIRSYIEAISQGNSTIVQRCWDRDAYFDLESGCSEICVEHILGTSYQVIEINLVDPFITANGRSNLHASITISCSQDEAIHHGDILLDSVSSDLPWKHWKIIHSSFGGTIAEPWCH